MFCKHFPKCFGNWSGRTLVVELVKYACFRSRDRRFRKVKNVLFATGPSRRGAGSAPQLPGRDLSQIQSAGGILNTVSGGTASPLAQVTAVPDTITACPLSSASASVCSMITLPWLATWLVGCFFERVALQVSYATVYVTSRVLAR